MNNNNKKSKSHANKTDKDDLLLEPLGDKFWIRKKKT